MKKLVLFLVLFTFTTHAEEKKLPFWKAKKAVYQSICEENEVVVSAKTSKSDKQTKVEMTAAGRIKVPLDFAYDKAIDFNQYSKILPYIDEVSYDKETSKLKAKGSFMGIKAQPTLTVKNEKSNHDAWIEFTIIKGIFEGMKGKIYIEKISDEVTEASLEAQYKGDSKIPDILLSWGLEFIGKKMAYKMRSYMESQWEKHNQ